MFGLQLAKTSPVFNRSDFLVASQQIAINSRRSKGWGRFEPANQVGLSSGNDSLDVQQCSANTINSKTGFFSRIRKICVKPCKQDAFETGRDMSWKGFVDFLQLQDVTASGKDCKLASRYNEDETTNKKKLTPASDGRVKYDYCTFEYQDCDSNVPFYLIKSRINDFKLKSPCVPAISEDYGLTVRPFWLKKNLKRFLSRTNVYEGNGLRGYHTASILRSSNKEKVEKLISTRSPVSYMYVPEADHLQPGQCSVKIETIAKSAGFDFNKKAQPAVLKSQKNSAILNKLRKEYDPRETADTKENIEPQTPLQRLMKMQSDKSHKSNASIMKKLNYKVPHEIEFIPYPMRKFHSKSAERTRGLKTKAKPRTNSFQLLKHQIAHAKKDKAIPKYKVILTANQTNPNGTEATPKRETSYSDSKAHQMLDNSTKDATLVEKSYQKKKSSVKMDRYGDYERNDKAGSENNSFMSYIRKKKYQKS